MTENQPFFGKRKDTDKGILVVSFGTSYPETREKTIDKIEEEIQKACPDFAVYRAWTSGMIIRKILKRDGIRIFTVTEAMEQMRLDGIQEVVVQPTHVLNGIENDQMIQDAMAFKKDFGRIVFGSPLLTSQEDNERVIQAVTEEMPLKEDEALVFMGHGTTHFANSIYAALDYQFKDRGYKNIFMGTVEAYPSMESLMKLVRQNSPRRVILAPFMIVAGDHASNDMSGDEDSWKAEFEAAGFQVECRMKGLGEYPEIRRIFIDHVQDAVQTGMSK